MTSIGIFIGAWATSKLGIGSAVCHISASITSPKHGSNPPRECYYCMLFFTKLNQAHHHQRSSRSVHARHVLQLRLTVSNLNNQPLCLSITSHPPPRCHPPSLTYSRYSFTPMSWILPSEYTKFMRDYYQEKEKDESCLFIAKPADLSRGRFASRISSFTFEPPF